MNILGISCFYHDAAAALVQDGILTAAAQEERFTRKRHDEGFPRHAIDFCLDFAHIGVQDLDHIVFYDRPFVKFERIIQSYIATFPRGFRSFQKALPVWLKEKMWIPQRINEELGYERRPLFVDHHMSHAASAFLVSPYDQAAILTLDGVGEWETTTYGIGRGNDIQLLNAIWFPHSLGLLYSAFTYYLGFRVNSAEYKVMGLAPFGEPRFADTILKNLVDLKEDGSFHLNTKYFSYHYGLTMTGKKFESLFGEPRRDPESGLSQVHKDIAASIQKVTDTIVVRMARHIQKETGMKQLCLAGGVALNCVSNSRILEHTDFSDVFVQPAAGDAGGSVGAAYYVYNTVLQNPRRYTMNDAYLGPAYSDAEIEKVLRQHNIAYRRLASSDLLRETASSIARQKVVGWFQGRMEFGPRALGSRSILADARNPDNRSVVNLKIKFRESFRPFAPTVLEDRTADYFSPARPSPYMLFVATVREDKREIPSVTHLDGSARLQTVSREQNALYYDLIKEFDRQTGCPVIINTSFNVRGEPIVCTPEHALRCFMRTEMDYLVIGSYIVSKEKVNKSEHPDLLSDTFEPD